MDLIHNITNVLVGSISTGLLLVGADFQSIVGREDEQVQCHSHLG